ncbi:hypothetical protein C1T31_05820 [Hanstruepera neustonica]|uniref:Lipoprotein n=1 Tax=Hanstruepera neustonica TaxID=1445657 RepID=A0A2K1E0N7_9FLAO|nr:DUF6252 family protein [Hanstruepera neustonica]PNQ73848.1 hypothetical protein C1T31_05820 [Hanstruepera neustonica]
MRTLKQIMLLVIVTSMVTLTSCKSDDDGGNPFNVGASSGTIEAKIDGNQFTSLAITSFANMASGGGQTTLVIQGNTQSQAINIVINGYEGVGSYEISDNNVFITASYIEPNISNPSETQTWTAPYQDSGVIGEISISEETDTKVKGTFSFDCKNSNDDTIKSVTEGSFDLTLQSS